MVVLFQAFKEALESSDGKFIVISSGAGTISKEMNSGQGVYGSSKVSPRDSTLLGSLDIG